MLFFYRNEKLLIFRMAKGGIEAPTEAEIKELSEIAIPEKPSREEERLLGMCVFCHY